MISIRPIKRSDKEDLYQLIQSVDKTLVGMYTSSQFLVEEWIHNLTNGLWEIYVAIDKGETNSVQPEEHKNFFQKIKATFNKFLGLDVNNKLVGVVTLYANHLEDDELEKGEFDIGITVAEEYQRQGIGSRLMKHLLERGKELDLEKASLWTRKDNTAMKKLAQKIGFTKCADKKKNGYQWEKYVLKLQK
jgi:ribosomal protein S18 acetylase RimI-like enzyme